MNPGAADEGRCPLWRAHELTLRARRVTQPALYVTINQMWEQTERAAGEAPERFVGPLYEESLGIPTSPATSVSLPAAQ